jgi:hypothetical protein
MSISLIRVIPVVSVISIFLIAGLFVLRAARNQQASDLHYETAKNTRID